jgi:FAD/FMN-containing dehydrogenase
MHAAEAHLMSFTDDLPKLAASFTGRLLLPDHADYDAARRIHNGIIDRRPALIAQCRGAADIADALAFAQAHHLDVAVRGGGHNVAGHACVDAGVMIDLSAMRGVRVDPTERVAVVDGGVTWREFNRETQLFGLGATGGVISSTGVAGLTLGGGFGWLMPKYGMALDHLRAVTIVLADGRVVRASAAEHPDLFWAVRGGGGNFGIVSTFEFELHPVGPMVTGGLVAHPYPRAAEAVRFFRDTTAAGLPDEIFMIAALAHAPDGSGMKIAGIGAVHCGTLEEAARALAPVKAFGPPVMDMMGPVPYTDANMMLDATFVSGSRNYWKSHFLPALPDAAIDALVAHFAEAPTPLCQIVIENFHGQSTRVPVDQTAYALRDPGYNALFITQWTDAADDERCIRWARAGYDILSRFGGPRRYANYMDADDGGDRNLVAVYGPNLPRLRAIKRTYDPANVFKRNLNIPPANA